MEAPNPAVYVRTPASWYGFLLIGTFMYLLNVQGNVIPFLQAEFQLSYRVVSLHASLMAAGIIATGFTAERIARRIGRRRALWLAAGCMGTGGLLICLAPGAWLSIAACALIGVGGGLVSALVPAMLSDLHGERRGEAYAEQSVTAYAFAIIGPLATGAFVAWNAGWRYAVIIGVVMALGLIAAFRRTPIPDAAAPTHHSNGRLPPAVWAYWCLLCGSCALEYSVILWAPTFLERIVAFPPAAAASIAAGFFGGVLFGRIALRALLTRLPARSIMTGAFIVGLAGFGLYWGIATPAAAIAGIVLLGLCVAPLYPLSMALAVGAAKGASDTAAARLAIAPGLALLVAPGALGALADGYGLSLAHLTLPAIILASWLALAAAGRSERQAVSRPA